MQLLSRFDPIALEEMDAVRLMNRSDIKYLFPTGRLDPLLSMASRAYRVLRIGDYRKFRYRSLYYDTADLKLYLDHHNGMRPRFKVRFREYVETGAVFLEVKRKTRKNNTKKRRIRVDGVEESLSPSSLQYVRENAPLDPHALQPGIRTLFDRITLVSKLMDERITIDFDLSFEYQQRKADLPFLTICEVKREKSSGQSPFMQLLKENRIYPGSGSKYCLGTLLLREGVKYNRFKPNLIRINQLQHESIA